jgi:hypothetical protein
MHRTSAIVGGGADFEGNAGSAALISAIRLQVLTCQHGLKREEAAVEGIRRHRDRKDELGCEFDRPERNMPGIESLRSRRFDAVPFVASKSDTSSPETSSENVTFKVNGALASADGAVSATVGTPTVSTTTPPPSTMVKVAVPTAGCRCHVADKPPDVAGS